MILASLLVAALVAVPAASAAADTVVDLTLEGRPVDRRGGSAVARRGVIYADAIVLTKSFNGLITLRREGTATITVGANTGTFAPGVSTAIVNARSVTLPGVPFIRGGDLFVPLGTFVRRIAGARLHTDGARRADIRVLPGPA